jgi:hypothetical protein
MPTQKWCNATGCKKFIFATLDDFAENGWSAFSIPANAKPLCFCPEHHKEMQQKMYDMMSKWKPSKERKGDDAK